MAAFEGEQEIPGPRVARSERREAGVSATREHWPYRLPLAVLIVGLLVTAALAVISKRSTTATRIAWSG